MPVSCHHTAAAFPHLPCPALPAPQINGNPSLNVKIQWATLGDYFRAVHKSQGVSFGQPMPKLPTLRGDFFSYADREDNYWTGYFTTRPFYKHLDRVLEGRLRAAEIAHSLILAPTVREGTRRQQLQRRMMISKRPFAALLPSSSSSPLFLFQRPKEFAGSLSVARQNLGVFQHHDGEAGAPRPSSPSLALVAPLRVSHASSAQRLPSSPRCTTGITGTAKDHVVVDYGKRMLSGLQASEKIIATAIQDVLAPDEAKLNVRCRIRHASPSCAASFSHALPPVDQGGAARDETDAGRAADQQGVAAGLGRMVSPCAAGQ